MSDEVICSVGISVSGSEEAEAIGFDNRAINRLTIRIAEFFLFKNLRVVFGHDWREDGVMRAVAQLAESAASGRHEGPGHRAATRMLNIVPTMGGPLSRLADDAQEASGGVLKTQALRDLLEEAPPAIESDFARRCWELWTLRKKLTDELRPGFRICVGGKTSGYSGYYAGVAEEAYFAVRECRPMYLIGGFGGATAAVCQAIDPNFDAPVASSRALEPPVNAEIEATRSVAESRGVPIDGLSAYFREYGIAHLSNTNGLTAEQNETLFEMTDIESALELIWIGARHSLELLAGEPPT